MKRTFVWFSLSVSFALLLIQIGGLARINAARSRNFQATKPAQPADQEVEFARREEMIPMRDGIRLHTLIFTPRNQSELLPIIMNPRLTELATLIRAESIDATKNWLRMDTSSSAKTFGVVTVRKVSS